MILAANRRLRITLLMPEWRDKYVPRDMRVSEDVWPGDAKWQKPTTGKSVLGSRVEQKQSIQWPQLLNLKWERPIITRNQYGTSPETLFILEIVNPINQEKQRYQSSPNWHKTAAKQNGFFFVSLQWCHRELHLAYMGLPFIDGCLTVSHKK